MSTHSSPPLSVGQNVLLPNPTTPLSITPSSTPSKMSILRAELLELKQTQSEQFEYLYQRDEQRQSESAETKELLKLMLDRLNTQIILQTERTSLDRRSADLEKPILDETSINLQQIETQSNQPKSAATPPTKSLTVGELN